MHGLPWFFGARYPHFLLQKPVLSVFSVCYLFLNNFKNIVLNFKPLTEQISAAKIKYFYSISSQN